MNAFVTSLVTLPAHKTQQYSDTLGDDEEDDEVDDGGMKKSNVA